MIAIIIMIVITKITIDNNIVEIRITRTEAMTLMIIRLQF